MKVLICPDKFKGSLSAVEAGAAMARGVKSQYPEAEITTIPMADGGEGSLDALHQKMDFSWQHVPSLDPLLRSVPGRYGVKNTTAHIEMALVNRLQLLQPMEQNPMLTSTLGTGILVADALQRGVKEIVLWVGGSATNDGGVGLAKALGFRFLDKDGKELSPIGSQLLHIRRVETPGSLPEVSFQLMTDVDNPLLGSNGAAQVYAAQKGASPEEVLQLDKGLQQLANVLEQQTGRSIRNMAGIGAAGGIGACLAAFCDLKIESGIAGLLDLYGFTELLKDADVVLTGEGKLDHQTLQGKTVKGIVQGSTQGKVPVWVFCGSSELLPKDWQQAGIEQVISIANEAQSLEYNLQNAAILLEQATIQAFKRFPFG